MRRTTIELTDDLFEKLHNERVRRRIKGFSPVIREALEAYFDSGGELQKRRARALALRGSVSDAQASKLRDELKTIRERAW
jgi:metal-responsive CopG/Arc/MetJ family transcriptional regulator